MSTLSTIERRRNNKNNSHPSVSSKPLIEYEEPNLMVMPKFAYLYACFSTKNVLRGVSSHRTI